jgi:Cu2+-exporting ATPase
MSIGRAALAADAARATGDASVAGPSAPAGCAHCGLRVPAALVIAGAPRQFCCEGCRAVHAVIHEHGLARYYALRGGVEPRGPARPSGRDHAELDDAGFLAGTARGLPDGLLAADLYLEGAHCGACVWLVERLPRLVPGVVAARLDLPRSRVTVTWDPAVTALSAAARGLGALGYHPHPCRGTDAEEARRREDRAMLARIGLAGASMANVMAIALALYAGAFHGMEAEYASLFRWASLAVTVPSLVWGGGVFFRGAWTALRVRALSMDLPISLGLLAGFAHGAVSTLRGQGEVYFDSVTALIFLLLVGRHVQRRQQRAAADATELVAALAPSFARRVEGETVREVPLAALAAGDLVEVRAGDLVPADGTVVRGRSSLDVSLLSGESRPVDVGEGDAVHAGTLNLASRLLVRALATGEATRVGRLLRLVDEHARRRAPIVVLADRIAGRFVAAVLALAGVTLGLWWGAGAGVAVDHAVALLVVTCPCALGLATPLAISAAIGRAARAGILIKGGDVLERLARPGRMWLDKTGTVTAGAPTLASWWGPEGLKPLVAAAEAHSAHPLARAFVAAVPPAAAGDVEIGETHGGGLSARVGPHALVVGAPAFVASRVGPLPPDIRARVEAVTAEGMTPVVVAADGTVAAVAAFGDPVRADAAPVLARIRALGWRVGLLSGDHPAVVAAVGRRLGLAPAECRGGVTPEGKLALVADARTRGDVVMVGDGVNDAAALAAAGVGIGVHGGAEAALSAAHVYLQRPGVGAVVDLLEGARATMRVIRRNLILSLGYNVLGVALAMAGLIGPLLAAILMPLSSLTVIASSYRARTFGRASGDRS